MHGQRWIRDGWDYGKKYQFFVSCGSVDIHELRVKECQNSKKPRFQVGGL